MEKNSKKKNVDNRGKNRLIDRYIDRYANRIWIEKKIDGRKTVEEGKRDTQ